VHHCGRRLVRHEREARLPTKLARALAQVAEIDHPPARRVDGPDAMHAVEAKLLAQVDAHREPFTHRAHDESVARIDKRHPNDWTFRRAPRAPKPPRSDCCRRTGRNTVRAQGTHPPGRKVFFLADSFGCTHDFLDWIVSQQMSYSVGVTLPDGFEQALPRIPKPAWPPAYDADGEVRDGACSPRSPSC
jgi:hypothetical protein